MRTLPLAYALLTGILISTAAQAEDAEVTIRVMDIDENSPNAVMRVISLPDKAQLRQTQRLLNSDTEQAQLRRGAMEQEQIQSIEIEAQHSQELQQQMMELDNMPQQAIDLQGSQELRDDLAGERR
jgi:hypothetical protein